MKNTGNVCARVSALLYVFILLAITLYSCCPPKYGSRPIEAYDPPFPRDTTPVNKDPDPDLPVMSGEMEIRIVSKTIHIVIEMGPRSAGPVDILRVHTIDPVIASDTARDTITDYVFGETPVILCSKSVYKQLMEAAKSSTDSSRITDVAYRELINESIIVFKEPDRGVLHLYNDSSVKCQDSNQYYAECFKEVCVATSDPSFCSGMDSLSCRLKLDSLLKDSNVCLPFNIAVELLNIDKRDSLCAFWMQGKQLAVFSQIPEFIKNIVIPDTGRHLKIASMKFYIHYGNNIYQLCEKEMNCTEKEVLKKWVNVHYSEIISIQIDGHTDHKGSRAYNQTLSENRANKVKDFLVSSCNIPEGIVHTAGYAYTRPANPNDPYSENNRRTEISILYTDSIVSAGSTHSYWDEYRKQCSLLRCQGAGSAKDSALYFRRRALERDNELKIDTVITSPFSRGYIYTCSGTPADLDSAHRIFLSGLPHLSSCEDLPVEKDTAFILMSGNFWQCYKKSKNIEFMKKAIFWRHQVFSSDAGIAHDNYIIALAYYNQGDNRDSLNTYLQKAYNNAVRITNPDTSMYSLAEIFSFRAFFNTESGDYEAALTALKDGEKFAKLHPVIKIHNTSGELFCSLMHKNADTASIANALYLYLSGMSPSVRFDSSDFLRLPVFYMREKFFDKEISEKEIPGDRSIECITGIAWKGLGYYYLGKYSKTDRKDESSYNRAGEAYFKALGCFKKIPTMKVFLADMYNQRAWLLLSKKEWDSAQAYLDSALIVNDARFDGKDFFPGTHTHFPYLIETMKYYGDLFYYRKDGKQKKGRAKYIYVKTAERFEEQRQKARCEQERIAWGEKFFSLFMDAIPALTDVSGYIGEDNGKLEKAIKQTSLIAFAFSDQAKGRVILHDLMEKSNAPFVPDSSFPALLEGTGAEALFDKLVSVLGNKNTTLVEYFVGENKLFIFTIRKNMNRPQIKIISKDDKKYKINANIDAWLEDKISTCKTDMSKSINIGNDDIKNELNELADVILADVPINNRMIFIPDGPLNGFPFEALRPGKNFLCNQVEAVSYYYSAALLLYNFHSGYDDKKIRSCSAYAPEIFPQGNTPWEGSSDIARIISSSIIPENPPVHTGSEAQASAFLNDASEALVLCAHYDAEAHKFVFHNDFLEENVILKGEKHGHDLVVLLCCQTASNEKVIRGEGTINPIRYFTGEGDKYIIGTCWNVPTTEMGNAFQKCFWNKVSEFPLSQDPAVSLNNARKWCLEMATLFENKKHENNPNIDESIKSGKCKFSDFFNVVIFGL